MKKNHSFEIDMCNGPLFGKILLFTLPLIFSGILQLLFNAADMVVVGRYAGRQSLAAVGSTSSLINLLVNVFLGLSVGVNVLISKYYGGGQESSVNETAHTAVGLSLICGIFLSIVGISLARPLLILMETPEDVLDLAVIYMRIFFAGMPFMLLYNFGSSILRAVGDTMRPLFFLLGAGVVNVLLNLLFVINFDMDVAGVALATVISQGISAFLVLLCLFRDNACYRLTMSKMRINAKIMLQIARIGLPAGIQGALFSVSNVIIQSSVNSFGSVAVAGNTAACNLEGFVYTSMNAFHQTSISFTGQNTGAGNNKRIRSILIICLSMVAAVGLGLGFLGLQFGDSLLRIYNDEAEVIAYGLLRMSIIFPTYFTCGTMDVLVGSIRGMGHSVLPMVVTLLGVCAFRIIWIFTVFQSAPSLELLYVSYPISWSLTSLAHLLCFILLYHKRTHKRVC